MVPGSTLIAGCVLSSGVKVGPNVDLKQRRLQSVPLEDDLGGDEVDGTPDAGQFGEQCLAFEYTEDSDSDGESEDSDNLELIEERWGDDDEELSDGFCSQEDEADDDDDVDDDDEVDGG